MTQALFIITGSSRGLGHAMVSALLARPQVTVIGIARKRSETLAAIAPAAGSTLVQWQLDLAQPGVAAQHLQDWLRLKDVAAFDQAALVNNAALITPPGPVESCGDADLSDALRVGLEAPVLLCAAFLRATQDWTGERRILNISSGLGRRAMAATAPYCAVKGGLDHFSRALAMDEALKPRGARVVSLAPGVIDTDMQVQLRGADPAHFPSHANFVQMKSGGQLASSEQAAASVLGFLARTDFGDDVTADVRGS